MARDGKKKIARKNGLIRAEGRIAITATTPSEPKPSIFKNVLDAVTPHLDGAAIATLSKARVRSLAKRATVPESDLAALLTAHKVASRISVPPGALFARSRDGMALDTDSLASRSPADLRKRIASAVKKNVVPSETLAAFDAAKATLGRLQAHETPIKTLVKTYDIGPPDSLVRKLQTKKIETLADVRCGGGTVGLAKALNVKVDDPGLKNLVSHAQLSVLGTDVGSNAILIEQGYTRISEIADAPDGVFVARSGKRGTSCVSGVEAGLG